MSCERPLDSGRQDPEAARRRQALWASKLPDPYRVWLLTSYLEDLYRLKRRAEKGRVPPMPTKNRELWGGHPDEIMPEYVGEFSKSEGEMAGLAEIWDLVPSTYDPDLKEDPLRGPPESWVPVTPRWDLPKTHDPYTFSTRELVYRYQHGENGTGHDRVRLLRSQEQES